MMLARYDRGLARSLLQPALDRWRRHAGVLERDQGSDALIRAAAIIDPHGAVRVIETLPEPTRAYVDEPKHRARSQFAHMAGVRGERLWRDYVGYWEPGDSNDSHER